MTRQTYYFGEDIITAPLPAGNARRALIQSILNSGGWAEVVPGMSDITVKFDPEKLSADEATALLEGQLDGDLSGDGSPPLSLSLPADFGDSFAPDAAMVAAQLGIARGGLPDWLMRRQYSVAMMGFQPGFAYLKDNDGSALPDIPRLDIPRQHVPAGSIGLLGGRACIYALDGPGGWPIVGRVTQPLIQQNLPKGPFLLSAGMRLKFAHASD